MIYTDVNHRDVSQSGSMLAAPFAAALALWHAAAPAAKRRAAASPGSPIRGFV